MPMVILSGYPCSGKTTRAEELKTFLETSHGIKVHIINDHGENIARSQLYSGMLFYYRPEINCSRDYLQAKL